MAAISHVYGTPSKPPTAHTESVRASACATHCRCVFVAAFGWLWPISTSTCVLCRDYLACVNLKLRVAGFNLL